MVKFQIVNMENQVYHLHPSECLNLVNYLPNHQYYGKQALILPHMSLVLVAHEPKLF